jgi:hypothetical protein
MKIAKIESTGKIVQVLRIVDRVHFSDRLGWILIDPDLGARDMTGSIGANMKWIPIETRFEWMRDVTNLALTPAS